MVGLICSNIELNNVGWNTFPRKNKYNLLIYKLKQPEFKSRTRYFEKPEVVSDLRFSFFYIYIMKTLCRICLGTAAGLALAGCSQKFKSAEKEIINAGDGGIMRVLTVTDRSDSLTLRRKSAPMAEGMERSDDYETLRRRMLATVRDPENTGVGIAAPQVGILRRMIAVQRFDKPGKPFEIYLNPEIVEYSAETAPGREGCLSIPGCYGEVTRALQIVLRYRDEQFAERTERIGGFTAVIFQHEVDHLDGILYTDRMDGTPLQRK